MIGVQLVGSGQRQKPPAVVAKADVPKLVACMAFQGDRRARREVPDPDDLAAITAGELPPVPAQGRTPSDPGQVIEREVQGRSRRGIPALEFAGPTIVVGIPLPQS